MPNTYSQIYIQIVFAVKNRRALIKSDFETDLFKYITGIIQQKGQLLIAINGVADHIHILIAMRPTCMLSDLIREVKKASNTYINENKFIKYKFEWQSGFGAFSYNKEQVPMIVNYIKNQKEHHKKKRFKDEFISMLEDFGVEFNESHIFKDPS